jgi:hypothetical protein
MNDTARQVRKTVRIREFVVILAVSGADQPSGCPNPNTEYRNPKEGRNPKPE